MGQNFDRVILNLFWTLYSLWLFLKKVECFAIFLYKFLETFATLHFNLTLRVDLLFIIIVLIT